MKLSVRLFILAFVAFSGHAQTRKPVVASDLLKITTATQIQISPDGNSAVTVVTRRAVKNESDFYYTRHLYLLHLNGIDEPTQLTFGDRNDSQPMWSPDSKQIAFVRVDDDKSQIWILPLAGGEAYPVTSCEFGANRPRWSPDGKRILYTSSIPFHAISGSLSWTYDRPGRKPGDEPNWKDLKDDDRKKISSNPDGSLDEIRAWLALNHSNNNPRIFTRLDFQGERSLQPEQEFSHLFVKTVGSNERSLQLTGGFQDFLAAEWAPDGKAIICHSRNREVSPETEVNNNLWVIDPIANKSKEFLSWSGYNLYNPSYSPDGTQIFFYAETIHNRHATQVQLGVVNVLEPKPVSLTAAFDRDVFGATWSSDSRTIYFGAQTEGSVQVFSTPIKGGSITPIVGKEGGVNDFEVRGNKIVYALTEIKNPWEVYVMNMRDKTPHQITHLNEPWVKNKVIATPKEYWFTKSDGTKIQYWVMEPTGRKEGMKYPTILNIHGGPSVMWGPGIFSMWHEYQLENSWGYGVVYCNPRGSSGYGDKFKKANYQDWGAGPADDILSSLEEAIKNNPWIDKDQLFIEGGSYAGYMVAWIIGHDNRFKAANAQRGVYDLTTFMGEGNAWRLVPNHFGGYPWDKETRSLLEASSPYTYVKDINTPLLIIHGDQDLRTGVVQSEMLYKSLKILNKPVEYVRYPKEGHELTRSGNPARMMDHLLRVIEFFERYAKHPDPEQ